MSSPAKPSFSRSPRTGSSEDAEPSRQERWVRPAPPARAAPGTALPTPVARDRRAGTLTRAPGGDRPALRRSPLGRERRPAAARRRPAPARGAPGWGRHGRPRQLAHPPEAGDPRPRGQPARLHAAEGLPAGHQVALPEAAAHPDLESQAVRGAEGPAGEDTG